MANNINYIGGDVNGNIIGRYDYVYNNTETSIVLATSDLNKILMVENAANVEITLPSIDVSNIGKWLKVCKIGAGNINIVRSDADTIETGTSVANTSPGEIWSNITLFVATATSWKFAEAPLGTWSTS
jgi:hypothetical protein